MKTLLLFLLIIVTYNLNAQWIEQNSGTTDTLRSVFFLNTEVGWACGTNGTILNTTNGGDSWSLQNTGVNNRLRTIVFRNELNGSAAGDDIRLTTTDGGTTWNISDTTRTYTKISVANDTTIWYGGTNEVLIRSTPAGTNFYNLNIVDSLNWHVLDIAAFENTVFVLIIINTQPEYSYYIFSSTNAGLNWDNFQIGNYNGRRYSRLFYRNDNSVRAGGYTLTFSRAIVTTYSLNGNLSSELMPGNTNGLVSGFFFANDSTGWVSTRDNPGEIYKTTNSGEDWFLVTGGLSNDIYYDIFFADENTGYTVGTSGKIYKTTNGGGTVGVEDEENIINKYSLSQNYPNPFNPSTKISFTIPERNFVTLKVYNTLGEEVAHLLNKEMNAGKHQINFNAEGLSSGVYFYKLSSGNFIETKKMILLR